MKLLVDMNLSPTWVDLLQEVGLEAVHWSSLGPAGATDETIFRYAADNGSVVLTNDLDFGALLISSGKDKPSVIQLRGADIRPSSIGRKVTDAIFQLSAELENGALVTIDAQRTRIRYLPFSME